MSRLYEASWLNLPRAPLQRAGWIELYASHLPTVLKDEAPRTPASPLFIYFQLLASFSAWKRGGFSRRAL
jgi:hypothetical protein